MEYIKNEDDFLKMFSSNLYNKIVKESTIKRDISREYFKDMICNLYYELNSNNYRCGTPDEMIFSYKTNNVSRIIPVLSVKDEIVYYLVCKILEDDIAVNRIENTYGGWRLGNKIKLEEDAEIEYVYKSYNPALWNDNWKAFQNIIYNNAILLEDDDVIIKLDIANFYDNVNLNTLEKKLLASVPVQKLEYVNILMYFLKNWNLKNDKYFIKTVGIPQSEFGDQSRLLANFYLQDYDKKIHQICSCSNAVYTRYADDQIIFLKNKKTINDIMYVVCRELNTLGLNLNASKVRCYTKDSIQILYGIPIFKLLDESKYDEAVDKFFEYYDKKDIDFNYSSSLKRFLNIGLTNFNISNKNKIKSIITEYQFVRECNEYYFKKIYNTLSKNEKKEFIELIFKISEETTYNAFHYNAINFLNKIGITDNIESLNNRIKQIRGL